MKQVWRFTKNMNLIRMFWKLSAL